MWKPFEYNYNDKRRCEILGLAYPPKRYGLGRIAEFKRANKDQLEALLEENFLYPLDRQNEAPTAQEIYEFIEKYPEVTAHGYIVSPDRHDYRVTIEGIEYHGRVSDKMRKDYKSIFRHADDFVCDSDYLYCWFD